MLISSSSSGVRCPCKASFQVRACGMCASFTMAMGWHCSRQKQQKPTPSVLRKWALIQTLCTTDRVDLAHPLPPVLQQQHAQQQQQQQQQRTERIWADMEIITNAPTVYRVTNQACAQVTTACYRLSTSVCPLGYLSADEPTCTRRPLWLPMQNALMPPLPALTRRMPKIPRRKFFREWSIPKNCCMP